MIYLKGDGGKKAGFAHADGWAAAAELTPLRFVRPSYRLLRPRYRENLYPAGTSHFPRPWAGHVRRAARPFGCSHHFTFHRQTQLVGSSYNSISFFQFPALTDLNFL